MNTDKHTKEIPQASRDQVLTFMAGLCVAGKETRAAEGYLLELLAYCAFSDPPSAVKA